MSFAKKISIKETMKELKEALKKSTPFLSKRIQLLIVLKKHESAGGLSKRVLANMIGADPNSVQNWRKLYVDGGLKLLLSHKKGGYKPSVIKAEQATKLEERLNKPDNNIVGFTELKKWFDDEFSTKINYKTLNGFVRRKFGAKIKVARKSHINKNPGAVEALKKTSVQSAKKYMNKKGQNLKQ